MDFSPGVLGLGFLLVGLIYRYVLFPAFLSPLARLPRAHPLCLFTSRWFKNQVTNMRELKTLHDVHTKHGPIVRLAPNEISVVSEEGLRQVYMGGLDKSAWYQQTFYVYGMQNLVSTLDHKTHSTVRRMIAGLYTKSFLQRSSDMDQLSRRIVSDRLLPRLQHYAQHSEHVDVVQLFEWTGVDMITAYIWGTATSTDFLNDQASRDQYFGEWKKARDFPDQNKEKPITEALYMKMTRAAIALVKGEKTGGGTQPLVLAKLFKEMLAKASDWNMDEEEIVTRCASELVDHVIATQETNTITWTYILYRLSQDPELQDELRRELHTLEPAVCSTDLPRPTDIDALPILNAVVLETLRLHAANPARLPRIVPAGGLVLHGYCLPAGTVVSSNAYCLHRNAEIFLEPLQWAPQRWLSDKESTEAMRRWFWAFGSGPRMCIGQHFALQVIKLVIASIYSQYTTRIVNDEGIEQSDSYNSGPISHRLVLQFCRASDF